MRFGSLFGMGVLSDSDERDVRSDPEIWTGRRSLIRVLDAIIVDWGEGVSSVLRRTAISTSIETSCVARGRVAGAKMSVGEEVGESLTSTVCTLAGCEDEGIGVFCREEMT
jgi:hypothetical protein